ncbi:GNAT family N-acetyltransferase [Chloroflexota bacterium]
MQYEVKAETFDSIASLWQDARSLLKWDCIYVLPGWLKSWWRFFGAGDDLYLLSIRDNDEVIGIAPLRIKNNEAHFMGDRDVCDWLDFVIAPGRKADFFDALIGYLRHKGVNHLNLAPVRHGSVVWAYLINEMVRDCAYDVAVVQEDVLVEMELPGSWEVYLSSLSTKQRHEVRRKLSKMENAGDVNYHVYDNADAMDIFLALFAKNRQDKAAFMTAQMQSFFISLAQYMSEISILKIGVLEMGSVPVAAVMCFDYGGAVYLYNSAYDAKYAYLSVGLVSKIMCIKDSVEKGKTSFNFLKGAEEYKSRLGGVDIPVYNCRISIC